MQAFPFPALGQKAPQWTGNEFTLGEQKLDYLSYDGAESGWSEELTDLHEKEAGDGNHPIDMLSRSYAMESMMPVIQNQGVILDVGCSSGFLLRQIKRAFPQAQLMGSDYLPGVVEKCAQKSPGIPMLQFDLRTCPFPDGCLDGVVALNVLEHIDQDKKALSHIFRILKPGGVAHIEVPAGPLLYDFYDEVLMHHRRYGKKELIQKCKKAGFRVNRTFSIGWSLYPGFCLAKILNKILGVRLSPEEKKTRVARAIQKTGISPVIKNLLQTEPFLGHLLAVPFGIRHCVILKKP